MSKLSMNGNKSSVIKSTEKAKSSEKATLFPKKDLKRKRVSSSESDSDDSSSSFDSSSNSESSSKSKSPIKPKIKAKKNISKVVEEEQVKTTSRIITPISIRAIAHQMSEFKQQFEQKMTRLELLLKEGFKAVADCSVQIEKLRSDMNLPELENELSKLPNTALLKDDRLAGKTIHPDASDYSDSDMDEGESIHSYSSRSDDDQDSSSSSSGFEYPDDYHRSFNGKNRGSHGYGFKPNKRFKSYNNQYNHPFK